MNVFSVRFSRSALIQFFGWDMQLNTGHAAETQCTSNSNPTA